MAVARAQYEILKNGVVIKTGSVLGYTRFKYVPPAGDTSNYSMRLSYPGSNPGLPAFIGSITFSALVLKR